MAKTQHQNKKKTIISSLGLINIKRLFWIDQYDMPNSLNKSWYHKIRYGILLLIILEWKILSLMEGLGNPFTSEGIFQFQFFVTMKRIETIPWLETYWIAKSKTTHESCTVNPTRGRQVKCWIDMYNLSEEFWILRSNMF